MGVLVETVGSECVCVAGGSLREVGRLTLPPGHPSAAAACSGWCWWCPPRDPSCAPSDALCWWTQSHRCSSRTRGRSIPCRPQEQEPGSGWSTGQTRWAPRGLRGRTPSCPRTNRRTRLPRPLLCPLMAGKLEDILPPRPCLQTFVGPWRREEGGIKAPRF